MRRDVKSGESFADYLANALPMHEDKDVARRPFTTLDRLRDRSCKAIDLLLKIRPLHDRYVTVYVLERLERPFRPTWRMANQLVRP
jgi:hypothetical protein